MNKINEARNIINDVDKKMAELFEQRMEAAKLVAEYKKEMGLPILDETREKEIIEKNTAYIESEEIRSYYQQFIKNNMQISRNYQHKLLEGMKIAYSGVEGAFAYIAAKNIFPDGKLSSFHDFKDAYQSVVNGESDAAVLPIENSFAGEVTQVIDLMFSGDLYINSVYDLPIVHNLLGIKGSKISQIKKVVSHPQALSQCSSYIKEKGYEIIETTNTAVAAKMVMESADPSLAAIASVDTAKLYNLDVLDHDINESNTNTTRFAVFTRSRNRTSGKDNGFIMLFTVSNTAGSLAKAIDVIGKNGFNMEVLRSRPMKELAWRYYFYIEAEGDINSENGQKMIEELKPCCDKLKVVGTYASNKNILKKGE